MTSPLDLFHLFDNIEWHDPQDCTWLENYQTEILLEQQSLSHRLLSYCEHFEAQVITSEWQAIAQLPDWAKAYSKDCSKDCSKEYSKNGSKDDLKDGSKNRSTDSIEDEPYLLRDVVLLADKTPWALGRSFIPKSTAKQAGFDLENQGGKPLGFTLFQESAIEREPIKIAQIEHNQHTLVARMSRLNVNHKPLIVMELFLLNSPIYLLNKIEKLREK